jgi:RNA polymerase sigma-70 factor, ECF subfamily
MNRPDQTRPHRSLIQEPLVSLNDLDLIDEIHAGSQAAFEQLMRRHEQYVFRIAYSYTGEKDGALDVSQNVFIKVHRNLKGFQGRSTFRSWLARIAQNESMSWLRSQKRHEGDAEATDLNMPVIQAVQDKALVREERSRDLLAEVHRLNERQRQAVLLRYFDRMPIREIGDVLECSEGQVKSILFRSLRKLRTHLSSQGRWDQELEA